MFGSDSEEPFVAGLGGVGSGDRGGGKGGGGRVSEEGLEPERRAVPLKELHERYGQGVYAVFEEKERDFAHLVGVGFVVGGVGKRWF